MKTLKCKLQKTTALFIRDNGKSIKLYIQEIDEILEFCKEDNQIFMHKIKNTGHSREIDILVRSPKILTEKECKMLNLIAYKPCKTNLIRSLLGKENYYVVNEDWQHMERHISPEGSMEGPIFRMKAFKQKIRHNEAFVKNRPPEMKIIR